MKRILLVLLVLVATVSFAGCQSDDGGTAEGRPYDWPPTSTLFPKKPYYVLQQNAYELADELAKQAQVEPNQLTFPEHGPGVSALLERKAGDVVVARPTGVDNPLGFARVVKSIYAENDQLVVTTRVATLPEIFEELYAVTPGALELLDRALGGAKKPLPVPKSLPLGLSPMDTGSPDEIPTFYLDFLQLPDLPTYAPSISLNGVSSGNGVSISGSLDADPIFEITPGITLLVYITGGQVRNFLFTYNGELRAGYSVDVSVTATASNGPGTPTPPVTGAQASPSWDTPPVIIPGSPVPLTVSLSVKPECSVSVSGSVELHFGSERSWSLGRKGLFYDDDSAQAASHLGGGPTDFGGATSTSGFDHTNPGQNAGRVGPAWFTVNWPNGDTGWQSTDTHPLANGAVEAECHLQTDVKFLAFDTAGPFVRLHFPEIAARAELSVGSVPGYCFSTASASLTGKYSLSAGVKVEVPLLGDSATLASSPTFTLLSGEEVLWTGTAGVPLGECLGCIATSPGDAYASCQLDGHCCSGNCNEATSECECSNVGGDCRGNEDCCNGTTCDASTLKCKASCAPISCTVGAFECASASARHQCTTASNGCLTWGQPMDCAPSEICANGACVPGPTAACGDGSCVNETCSTCPADCGACCQTDGAACGWSGDCCSGHCQAGTCQWLTCGQLAPTLGWQNALCQQSGQNVCFGQGYPTSDCALCCNGTSGGPTCTAEWQACASSTQCCAGLSCKKDPLDNTLACLKNEPPAPSCKNEWENCQSTADCCGNLKCKKDPGDNTWACQS